MQLHEYQAKKILRNSKVPIPDGRVTKSVDQVKEIASSLGGKCVVKAQVHAGGRGKAGGIKLADSPSDAFKYANNMLGSSLKTFQSGDTEFPINEI